MASGQADRSTLLTSAAGLALDYLETLDQRGVAPAPAAVEALRAVLAGPLPEAGSDAAALLDDLARLGGPATVASAGGRYFGFVTGGALPAALAASWLAGAWDQNGFSHVSSPAAPLFEEAALGWLKQVLRLPDDAAGALVTGATLANFTCLAAARHRVLARAGWDVESQGLFGAPPITLVVGEEAHGSLMKVLALLGFGRDRVLRVPADSQGRMRTDALPDIGGPDQVGPAILCLQAGNVNSGAFDPAEPVIAWARRAGAWVHVDGAFGLWAAASPGHAVLCRGFEAADSWATDAHKWLNVPYDCGVALVRDAEALHNAMSISGAYLLQGKRRDPIDLSPESSRRARGIEVWAALRSLGRQGLAELVARNCRQARRFADGLSEVGIAVLNEVVLNQVVVAFGDDALSERVIAAVQQDGVCWCGGTTWQGRKAMRISVSSWATSDEDVERSLAAIVAAYQRTP